MHASPASPPSRAAGPQTPLPPSTPRPQWGLFAAGLLAGALISGGTVLIWDRPAPPPMTIQLPPTQAPALPTPSPTPAPIVVDVTGAVAEPGVYTLPAGARVVDALQAAGGLLPEADALALNRATPLYDGAQVFVPRLGEVAVTPVTGVSGEIPPTRGITPGEEGIGLVNVNSASAAELETLPGIGPSKAAAIIANRPYHSVDDLDRVPGIGPATLDQIRDLVTVQ